MSMPAIAQEGAAKSLHKKPVEGLKLLNEAYELTKRNFYSSRVLREKGWDRIRDKYVARAKAAIGPEEIHDLINEMLGELKTSHLALVDGTVFDRHLTAEFNDRKVAQLGCEFIAYGRSLYIGGILEGSAIDKAGLKSGDCILQINGLPAIDAENLAEGGHDPGLPGQPGYVLLVDKDEEVKFLVQKTRDGEAEEITVKATEINMIQAVQNSIRVVKINGRKIGIVHTWHFMSTRISTIVRNALQEDFRDCDGVIFDIRGRGGSTMVVYQLLNMFTGRRAIWKRPAVVLTSHHTRSAKEIFSLRWQKAKRGPVVGETTQGACIGTIFKPLSDGSYMLLPRVDVKRLTGGVEIEGVGVAPTIPVNAAPLRFSRGKDTILEGGLKVLGKLIQKDARVH